MALRTRPDFLRMPALAPSNQRWPNYTLTHGWMQKVIGEKILTWEMLEQKSH